MVLSSFVSLLSSAMSNGVEQRLSGTSHIQLSQLVNASVMRNDTPNANNNANNNNDPNNADGSLKRSSRKFAIPSFLLKGHLSGSDATNQNVPLTDVASLNLANPFDVAHTTLDSIPRKLLQNVTASFQQLITSRLRCSIAALIAQTTKLGNSNEASVLTRLFNSRNPIKITTVVTSFVLVPNGNTFSTNGFDSRQIIFETIIDIDMLGKIQTVTLSAPGTISVSISPMDLMIQSAEIAFDTDEFLKIMMQNARLLVRKTMKRAAKITTAYTHMKRNARSTQSNSQQTSQHQQQQEEELKEVRVEKETEPRSSKIQAKYQDLLTSYPSHLREIVRQFLPTDDTLADESIEGFPPQLTRTLRALANGESSPSSSQSSSEKDANELQQPLDVNSISFTDNHQREYKMSSALRSASGLGSSIGTSDSPRPLKKRRTKVSFSLPNL